MKNKSKGSVAKSAKTLESFILAQDEYPIWLTKERVLGFINSLPGDPWWNALFSIYVLSMVIISCFIQLDPQLPPRSTTLKEFVNIFLYEIPYIFHVSTLICNDYHSIQLGDSRSLYQCGYILDVVSLSVPFITAFVMGVRKESQLIDLVAISLRMHRPFAYLGSLNYYLKGSIIGTLLKYLYISVVIRIFFAFVFIYTKQTQDIMYDDSVSWLQNLPERQMFRSFYEINKIYIPMGPDHFPRDVWARLLYIVVMLSGALLIMGLTIASMSLIIGLYMRPEEEFRSRFRLIMDDMEQTNLPPQLRKKVETFYRMFWHKQSAVSETRLLPIYPRSLATAIRTNIYFKAMQKSRIICNLSSPFLSELAKHMETVHYIPGDFIIKRNSSKSTMFFISCGDVELLSAEDDETALLRFTRGTILNPLGACAEIACTRSCVAISAATFCTAHVLKANDLWMVANKYHQEEQSLIIRESKDDYFTSVKIHFSKRIRPEFKYKSNIVLLKLSLMELKEARDDFGNLLLERADLFINIADCYVMRNQSDMSLTEEADEICLRQTFPCILQPASSLVFAWDFFVALITIIVTFAHPYYLIFIKDVPIGFRFFNYMATFVYILDTFVQLSTGAKVEEGVPLTFMQTSSEQMKSYWFMLNIFSVVPIFEFIHDSRYAGINKLAKVPQIFRTLKNLEDLCVYHSNVLRFFSVLLLIIILTYLVGALKQFYTCVTFGHCVLTNLTCSPYWTQKPLDNGPVAERLMFSWYYAISIITYTSIKTAAYAQTHWRYQLFILILVEVCTVVFILIESTYSATIMVTGTMSDRYKSCIETVKTFLKENNMDPELRHRFINYLQLCWYTDKAYAITHEKKSILFDLPPHVNEDILTMQRSKYFLCIPFMKFLPNDDFKKISAQARLFYTAPNEILLNTGEISNEIYVIKEGVCEVLDPDTKKVVRLLKAKGYFGDIECLLRLPAYHTVRAASHVRLYSISWNNLEKCLSTPKLKDAINYAKDLPEYGALVNARPAFLKYETPENPPNREHFPLLRKHEVDYAFLHPFYRYGYFSILRYVFPRYTFRPDGVFMKRYEWFRSACALTSALIYPTYTMLVLQWPWLWQLTWFLDITAYADIILRMLVGYFNKDGILIYHPASTFTHYIKGAFLVDILGCLPMEYLDYVRTTIFYEDNAYRIPSTYTVLMYNRLLQLYRVPNTLDILEDYIDRQDIILIIKAVPVVMGLICLVTSLMVEASIEKWRKTSGGWRLEIRRHPIHGSWIEKSAHAVSYNITETPWNAVLTTFYWVVYETTSTGFNLFQPSQLEMIGILTAGMLLGTLKSTYYTVRVISIRANVNEALGHFQEHMKDIITFMKREKLSKELQRMVVTHYENNWERMGGTDYCSILKLCDQITLRTDAILHIYGQTFAKCPILTNDISLLRNVGRAVRTRYMRKTMTVIQKNDVISEMYIVASGVMELHDHINDKITYLPQGSLFGNLDNLKTVVCPMKFVAGSQVHLLEIDADKFYKTIEDFPAVKVLLDIYRPYNENFVKSDQPVLIQKAVSQSWGKNQLTKTKVILKFLERRRKTVQIYTILISMLCVYGDLYNAGFQDNSKSLIIVLYLLDFCFSLTILLKIVLPHMAVKNSSKWNELVAAKKSCISFLTDDCRVTFISGTNHTEEMQDEAKTQPLIQNVTQAGWPILLIVCPASLSNIIQIVNVLPFRIFKYQKNNFYFDIFSCIPIEILCLLSSTPSTTFAFLRLNRCLRLISMYETIGQYHKNLSINLTVTTVASVAIWFTMFVHTASCIWFYLGVMEDRRVPYSSWRYKTNEGNNTICDKNYICSVYFIVTTFTLNGVGDILPRQQSEVAFVSILMILSTIIFMIYVGEFSNIIQYRSFRYYAFYSYYLELQAFLKNNRVSENLSQITQKYTLHLWQETRGLQFPHFLKSAPQCLRLDVMSAAYMHHLKSHPVFARCDPSFLRQLVGHLQLYHYSEGLYVVKGGEITNSMYFIHKGRIKHVDDDFVEGHGVYKTGDYFGTVNGLSRAVPYDISYKTIIMSQVLTLCFDNWEYLLHHFPNSKRIIDSGRNSYDNSPSRGTKKYKRQQTHRRPGMDASDEQEFFPTSTKLQEPFNASTLRHPGQFESSQLPMEIKRSTGAGSTVPEATINSALIENHDKKIKNPDNVLLENTIPEEGTEQTLTVLASQASTLTGTTTVNQKPLGVRRSTAAGSTEIYSKIDNTTRATTEKNIISKQQSVKEEADQWPHTQSGGIKINNSIQSDEKSSTRSTDQSASVSNPTTTTSSKSDKQSLNQLPTENEITSIIQKHQLSTNDKSDEPYTETKPLTEHNTSPESLKDDTKSTELSPVGFSKEASKTSKLESPKEDTKSLSHRLLDFIGSLLPLPILAQESIEMAHPTSKSKGITINETKTDQTVSTVNIETKQDKTPDELDIPLTRSKVETDLRQLVTVENVTSPLTPTESSNVKSITIDKTNINQTISPANIEAKQDKIPDQLETPLTKTKVDTDLRQLGAIESTNRTKTPTESSNTTLIPTKESVSKSTPNSASATTLNKTKLPGSKDEDSVSISLEEFIMAKKSDQIVQQNPSKNVLTPGTTGSASPSTSKDKNKKKSK